MADHIKVTTPEGHTIEIDNGYLTIDGEDKTLIPTETDWLLEALLIKKYGLKVVSVDELED